MNFESPITELDLEIRTQKTKDGVRSALMDGGVPWDEASQYSEDWARKFVEDGLWTHEALEALRSLAKKHCNGYDIYNAVLDAVKPHMLTFLEKVKLGVQEIPEEKRSEYEEDLKAIVEIEKISSSIYGPMTDDQYDHYQLMALGIDPHYVHDKDTDFTKDDIETFKRLGRKFGLPAEEISLRLAAATSNTTMGQVQILIDRFENQNWSNEDRKNKLFRRV